MTPERWCAMGNHFRPKTAFPLIRGKLARDCAKCIEDRAHRRFRQIQPPPPAGLDAGVDIDAIHFKRGLVAPHLRRAR